MKLTKEEKIFIGRMGTGGESFKGKTWFMGQEELQVVASLARKGIVALVDDYEGHEVVVVREHYSWLEKKYPQFFQMWLVWYQNKKMKSEES